MMLVAILIFYVGIGIMAAILDYWDFDDMIFRYTMMQGYAPFEELKNK